MSARRATLGALLVLIWAAGAAAHRNYTRPDLHVTCKVGAKALLCGVSLPARVLTQILERPIEFVGPPSAADQEALREAVFVLLREHNPVHVDGRRVEAELRSTTLLADLPHDALLAPELAVAGITLHQSRHTVLRMVLGYPLPDDPRHIGLTWDLERAYTTTSPDLQEARRPIIPVNFLYEGEWTAFELTPEEPQFTWHAPRPKAERAVAPTPVLQPAILAVPVVAVGCLLGLLVLSWRARRRPGWLIGLLALGAGGVFLPWPGPRLMVPLPWTQMAPPDAAEAAEIFEALHRAVYRAFDAEGETAIYDTLAAVVDGPLLDWMYGEVYQGLVMRDQGGAVARVQGVDVLETHLEPPPDPAAPAFRLRARWRVLGTVSHWGHSHQRVNEYEALYTIDRRDHAWKIVGVAPGEQRRVR